MIPEWNDDLIVCIGDIESAETMLLIMSHKERKALESNFNLQYLDKRLKDEGMLSEKILNHKNSTKFLKDQQKIKELIQTPLNINTLILEHSSQIALFLQHQK